MISRLIRHRFSVSQTKNLKFTKDINPHVQISKLRNGITVYTEKSSFPTQNDIGICFRAGHRDELPNERGALFNLKSRLFHTNETDFLTNFESICRTGAMLDMILDQETTYYKCQFLQEDLHDMLDITLKLALTPKQIFDSEVEEQTEIPVIPFAERITQAAYRGQLMANCATEGQITEMDRKAFGQFQSQLFTPQNMAVGYAGLLDHQEFLDLIENKLSRFPEFLSRRVRAEESYKFKPGTVKIDNDNDDINIAIVFEGLPWRHPTIGVTQIAEKILGSSASWSSGGPGKGMRARTTINMMNQIASIESASAINNHYLQSGLFGLKVSGYADDRFNLLDSTINELKEMVQPMTEVEFLRGRNCLQSLIQLNLERQADRLEENVKNIFTVGKLTYEYIGMIDGISKETMQNDLRRILFNSEPVVVYEGKGASELPNMEEVLKRIRN